MGDAGVGIQVESGIDGDLYRKVLGRYPTGVTLVTGMGDGEPLAMLPTDQGPEAVAAELDKWVR